MPTSSAFVQPDKINPRDLHKPLGVPSPTSGQIYLRASGKLEGKTDCAILIVSANALHDSNFIKIRSGAQKLAFYSIEP